MTQLEENGYAEGEEYYRNLQEQFRSAQNSISLDIERWYQRIADNNGVSLASAKRMLSRGELQEFHWTVEQYIKAGQENAIDQRWMRELENASASYHISRLEAMKLQMQQHCELLSAQYEHGMTDFLHKEYADQFYHSAFEIEKGTGVGVNLAKLDESSIDTIIKKPWAADGRNYSSRIWENKEKLVGNLNRELSQCLITGESPEKAVERLSRIMEVSKAQARRLVMTELAAINAKATLETYMQLGIEEYEVVATLDNKTSEICREMDGKHFRTEDFEIGVTANPFHPHCRTTTAPYFDDEDLYDDDDKDAAASKGERAARGADGKTEKVPADMTYPEWERRYVKSNSRLKKEQEDVTINSMDITEEWLKTQGKKGRVIEREEYTVGETIYKIDGHHVVLDASAAERTIAGILSDRYGKTVELVPKVNYPVGVQTPDYLIDGVRYDLKSPTGRGKYLLKGLIAKKRKQADNFIIDITGCPLSMEEIERQINELYKSPQAGFVMNIVVMKDDEVVKVFSRK